MLFLALALSLGDSLPRRAIEVASGEYLNTVSVGEGPAIVLLNGLVGGAYGFRKIIPELASRGYRVVAIEPLGLGESSRPKHADYSLAAQSARIGHVLDTLGITNAVLVAHSLGASYALRLASERPDLVRGLVSIDGGPQESAAPPGLRKAMRWAPILKLFVGRGSVRKQVRKQLIDASRDTTWLTAEVLDGYTDGPGKDVGAMIDAFHGMVHSTEPDLIRDRLPDLRIPVRLLIGAAPHSTGIDSADTELMRREIRDFAVDSVAGSGQLIHEEQPEVVVQAVLALEALLESHAAMEITPSGATPVRQP
jgi:pimeloyl-ACP methyl ester carboxylesterase